MGSMLHSIRDVELLRRKDTVFSLKEAVAVVSTVLRRKKLRNELVPFTHSGLRTRVYIRKLSKSNDM